MSEHKYGQPPMNFGNEWISVTTRYPDDARDVITFGKFGVQRACFELGQEDDPCWWSKEISPPAFKESVTHWAEVAK
jgi:hypothetical protein